MIEEWFREHQPDVVIGCEQELLRRASRDRPGCACVQLQGPCEGFDGGLDSGAADVASATIDCLVEKLRRFEKGVRESTRLHLIKGAWEERGLVRREAETFVA